tara:strand:+ start:117 stop:365 length:249 start_codon:yes stop_codon:yes gene_type:complete
MIEYITSVLIMWGISETINCSYPYYAEDDENVGLICKWDKDEFYYNSDRGQWILKRDGIDDNCIEEKARIKYWNRRDKFGFE